MSNQKAVCFGCGRGLVCIGPTFCWNQWSEVKLRHWGGVPTPRVRAWLSHNRVKSINDQWSVTWGPGTRELSWSKDHHGGWGDVPSHVIMMCEECRQWTWKSTYGYLYLFFVVVWSPDHLRSDHVLLRNTDWLPVACTCMWVCLCVAKMYVCVHA